MRAVSLINIDTKECKGGRRYETGLYSKDMVLKWFPFKDFSHPHSI